MHFFQIRHLLLNFAFSVAILKFLFVLVNLFLYGFCRQPRNRVHPSNS